MTTPVDTLIPPEAAPLTARGAATRARIVEAAADLVYERGVAATSLDDIMAASRTSKSQLYHYFADKDVLICAVILRQTERVLDGQDPYLRDLDSMAGLRRWCAAILEIQQQRRGLGGVPGWLTGQCPVRLLRARAAPARGQLPPVGGAPGNRPAGHAAHR